MSTRGTKAKKDTAARARARKSTSKQHWVVIDFSEELNDHHSLITVCGQGNTKKQAIDEGLKFIDLQLRDDSTIDVSTLDVKLLKVEAELVVTPPPTPLITFVEKPPTGERLGW